MVRVKICGLTNLADARHAAACGADLLGFIFVAASPRYIAPEQAAGIIAALRAEGCTAQLVGVFDEQPAETVNAVARECDLDLVQLHGSLDIQYTLNILHPYLLVHRVAAAIPWDELAAYAPTAIVLDTYRPHALGGTGATWDWQALADASTAMPLILAGGLNPDNVAEAIHTAMRLGTDLWGVDVGSGVERAPGLKDHAKVRALIDAVKGCSV